MAEYSGFGKLISGVWTDATPELNKYHVEGVVSYNPHKWGSSLSDFDVQKYLSEQREVMALSFVSVPNINGRVLVTFIEKGKRPTTDKDILFAMFKGRMCSDNLLRQDTVVAHLNDVYISRSWTDYDENDNPILDEPIPHYLNGDGNWDFSS